MSSHDKTRPPSTGAVRLSALVLPGFGQCRQGRYVAGIAYLLLFAVLFVCFCVFTARVVVGLYHFAANFADPDTTAPSPNVAGIVVTFLLAMLVYVANVVDVFVASRKSHR